VGTLFNNISKFKAVSGMRDMTWASFDFDLIFKPGLIETVLTPITYIQSAQNSGPNSVET